MKTVEILGQEIQKVISTPKSHKDSKKKLQREAKNAVKCSMERKIIAKYPSIKESDNKAQKKCKKINTTDL